MIRAGDQVAIRPEWQVKPAPMGWRFFHAIPHGQLYRTLAIPRVSWRKKT